MLHDQDSSMIMMDAANNHSMYRMDLEYGKVVDEWKVHDDVEVRNFVPSSKCKYSFHVLVQSIPHMLTL